MSERPAWFVYRRGPGKLQAWPAAAMGWLTLTAAIAAPLGTGALAKPSGAHPLIALAVTFATMAASFVILFRLIVRRGRAA